MANSIGDKIFISKGYVDATMGPIADVRALSGVSNDNRFVGLTVAVLAPIQMEVWLAGGTSNAYWKVKSIMPVNTKADMDAITASIVELKMHRMFGIGTEVIVLKDETNDNKMTKYWTTEVGKDNVVWEKVPMGEGAVYTAGDGIEINNNEISSYVNVNGEDIEEAIDE